MGTSGSVGTGLAGGRGGGGGTEFLLELEEEAVTRGETTDAVPAAETLEVFPGRGCAAGFGLEAGFGFCHVQTDGEQT